MPAWLALPLTVLSAWMMFGSFRASREAARTGQIRHLLRWTQRDRNPMFFKIALALKRFDILFFGVLTIVVGALFLEAIGFIR